MTLTKAQELKARRFVALGKVRRESSCGSPGDWGKPWTRTVRYVLGSLPGTNQVRSVTVTESYDGEDRLVGLAFRCDCQHADAQAGDWDLCSHAAAVRLHRTSIAGEKERPREAAAPASAVVADAPTKPLNVVGPQPDPSQEHAFYGCVCGGDLSKHKSPKVGGAP